jgi:uncharacterized membrane protein YqjE
MIGPLIAQLVGTAVASKKRAIAVTIRRIVLVLIGAVFLLAAFSFALVTLYHALAPWHFTPVEAAAIITVALLVIGGILVAVALRKSAKAPPPAAAALDKPDLQSAELTAIEALGMLNKALNDMGHNRGGASPYLGMLGIAALVGFVSGRKR